MSKKTSMPIGSDETKSRLPGEFSDAMAWAAWLYFVDGMTQTEVAKTIGVSRVTVIKLLSDAKENGIVSVRINPAIAARVSTSRKLARKFGLNEVVIIPDNDDQPLVDRLGKAGAYSVMASLKENDVIGVAWGRTILSLAQRVKLEQPVANLTVVQVSASPNGLSADFSPELCASLLANNLGARSVNLMAPAIVSSAELRAMLLKEPTIRNQLDVIRSANKVIFGVGDLGPSATVRRSEVHSDQTVDTMIEQGAVAAVLGMFLDAQGVEVSGPTHDRMMGISLDELRAIPNRLCVAGGDLKIEAVGAALRGGFATDLITDLKTGKALLSE